VITFLEQISIPEQISRFSLQFEVSGGWLGDFSKFCVSDNKVKCEFITQFLIPVSRSERWRAWSGPGN
jgi:hypothetical protein